MDKYEELEKILKMKENGIINEEEYQKLKSSIIFNEGSNKRVNQSNPIMIFKIIGIVIGLIGILAFFLPYISNPQSSSYYSSQESVIINGIKITDTAFQSISEFFSYIIESNSYELTGDIVFMVIINIITMLAPLVFLIIHIILLISSIIMRRKKDLTPICIINFITFIVYLVISIVRVEFFQTQYSGYFEYTYGYFLKFLSVGAYLSILPILIFSIVYMVASNSIKENQAINPNSQYQPFI